ncbi:sensor histidine kinase [Crocinitomix catalasitica]|uniref:sensor histidine kinase n=1 Tax=Crocinitomix catalasitica TaxID=184607 RepID=UPI00047F8036|nr:ATP-binding protein [Crocinitomix catalasitica]
MNLSKPIHLILIGSTLLSVLVFSTLLLFESFTKLDFSLWSLFLIPLITFGLSLGVFTYLVGRFINDKIKVIYRIISKKQLQDEEKNELSISADVLTKLTEDTAQWAKTQKKQIIDLQRQAEFRKEFLGNLAHELKTPVFSIQGYILTLLEGGLEDERVNRDFLERALTGVDRISNLLEDLDHISTLERDRFALNKTKIDIVDLAKQSFKELEGKADDKHIKLSFVKHYDPIFINGDRHKLAQVFINLISNSISYGTDGGYTKVRFERIEEGKILIEVSDNGVGMDEQHIPRLFERFYRVDKSRERNVGGSGLGLAIVKHIIEAHEQSINVRSTIGVGSTFSFTLDRI